MTDEERRAVRILMRVRYQVGSWDKKFVIDMADRLKAEMAHVENTYTLTERQHEVLLSRLHRYRRQHGQCECLICLKEAMERDNPAQLVMFAQEGVLAK